MRWQKEHSGSYHSGSHSQTEVITETATHKFMLNEEWGSGRISGQSSTSSQIVTLRYNLTDSKITRQSILSGRNTMLDETEKHQVGEE